MAWTCLMNGECVYCPSPQCKFYAAKRTEMAAAVWRLIQANVLSGILALAALSEKDQQMAVTYKTHFLLALKTYGEAKQIARWEHCPTGAEVATVRDKVVSDYNEFVLVTPVGDTHAGTYVEPTHDDCCG